MSRRMYCFGLLREHKATKAHFGVGRGLIFGEGLPEKLLDNRLIPEVFKESPWQSELFHVHLVFAAHAEA